MQRHSGLLGLIMKSVMHTKSHLIFDRFEANDRKLLMAKYCNGYDFDSID